MRIKENVQENKKIQKIRKRKLHLKGIKIKLTVLVSKFLKFLFHQNLE